MKSRDTGFRSLSRVPVRFFHCHARIPVLVDTNVSAGGPGGQNVNKVNTKVDLRFKVADADWLPERVDF